MNLPNQLTVARLGLTVLFVVAAYSPVSWALTAAAVLFGIASFTDYLDGRIARQRGLVTSFGQLMDPLADKVLMAAAFVVPPVMSRTFRAGMRRMLERTRTREETTR